MHKFVKYFLVYHFWITQIDLPSLYNSLSYVIGYEDMTLTVPLLCLDGP